MPDGSYIKDYKLINVTNAIAAIDHSKSEIDERTRDQYRFRKKYCLGPQLHLSVDKDKLRLFSSEILRKNIEAAGLTGRSFKNDYAGIYKFIEDC